MTGQPFQAAGSLLAAYRAVDWSGNPLGDPASWTQALRQAVDLILQTRFPATLFWGPELVLVYNEAYTELIADKHPQALGSPARDVFPEAWEQIGPMMHGVLDGQPATWVVDELVPLDRHGFVEDCFFTFCYSPVRNVRGEVEGVLDIAAETTSQVITHRRLVMLNQLRAELVDLETTTAVLERAVRLLRSDTGDFTSAELMPAPDHIEPGEVAVEQTTVGRIAWLPVRPEDDDTSSRAVRLQVNPKLRFDATSLDYLRLLGAALNLATERVTVRTIERRAAASERRMSEALQRSLLTAPAQVPFAEIAVRYLPAAEQARVGGDWYDSFTGRDGALTVVIGDVAGHDREAAAAMAQVRNVLRGIAYGSDRSPAEVLRELDTAMSGLGVESIATAVLARVDHLGKDQGLRFRWTNAGHPPPVLMHPDGKAELLTTVPDLLLGLAPERRRQDHEQSVPTGSAIVLYTDGLVERRGAALTDGLDWLADAATGLTGLDAEAICDRILGHLDGSADDDIALLVLRVT